MYKSHGKDYIENNFSQAELAALMKAAPSPPASTPPGLKAGPLSSKKPLPVLDFNCNMCGSKFLTRGKLMHHMQSHGVILVSCPTCSDKFMSAMELQNHINQVHKRKGGKKARKPGPASRTNAPPEKRGSTSLPTYLQLTQVSRRSSMMSDKMEAGKENSVASEIVAKLAKAAACKAVKPDEKQSCNFCTFVAKNQVELSGHLVNEHFKGLISPNALSMEKCPCCPRNFNSAEALETHIKSVHRAKQIRRSLGLEPESEIRRRPGPKRAKLMTQDLYEGTICNTAPLPSVPSVLSASKIVTSFAKSLRPVVLSSLSNSVPKVLLRPPSHVVNMMLNSASSQEEENNNNNNDDAHSNLMLSMKNLPRKKSECPVCGIVLSPKTNVNVHLRTHSGVRPYECVLCLNRFRQKAHLMKHFRCTHNQKQPPHICLFCSLETATSNDLYRHITDQHSKETDELRPSLLAARSDAQAAAKAEQQVKTENEITEQDTINEEMNENDTEQKQSHDQEEQQRYDPITEDFMYEDQVIAPCYVVLPYVSEEEVEAAGNSQMVMLFFEAKKLFFHWFSKIAGDWFGSRG